MLKKYSGMICSFEKTHPVRGGHRAGVRWSSLGETGTPLSKPLRNTSVPESGLQRKHLVSLPKYLRPARHSCKSGTEHCFSGCLRITGIMRQLTVTESLMLPPMLEGFMEKVFVSGKVSHKYRLKALVCEKLARDTSSSELKAGWSEMAIEWHALASRIAQEISLDHELKLG
jgi:hypothetical protein